MKTVGKVVLAIVLGYVGLMVASFMGGFLAGALGAIFRLSKETISQFEWVFPKVIFIGVLVTIYVWEKRKKVAR